MPGQLDQIAQMLGGQKQIQGNGMRGSDLQEGHRSAQAGAFDAWLGSLGIVGGNLPPEVKMQYYQLWMQMQEQERRMQPYGDSSGSARAWQNVQRG